jgi:hypothetical protein
LDPGLLVDAEHDRPAERVQVEPDHVGDLLSERGITRQLEADPVAGDLYPRYSVPVTTWEPPVSTASSTPSPPLAYR